jgi:serine/threonine-protein kinase
VPRNDDTNVEEMIDVDLDQTKIQSAEAGDSPWAVNKGNSEIVAIPTAATRLGRYSLKHLIGKGGMAEVFLATQDGPAGFEKVCVVKRIRRSLVEEKRFVEMFLREARVAARLNHPNVVQIFELGEHVDQLGVKDYFIAMEFLDGLSLHRAARRSWQSSESVPMEVALRATADAALGLHHAHTLHTGGRATPLVHRDVSPDNIILTRDGNAKLLDFGIAKSLDVQEMTGTGEVKGKIPFMAPEQLQGQNMDGRTDLWALGVTLYWLLTGRRPFDGPTEPMTIDNILRKDPESLRKINPLVPASVDALVLQLLQKDMAKRVATGAELADRLLAMLGPSSSYAAAASFVMHASQLPDDPAGAPQPSLLTIIAARPESQWLKKLDSQSPDQLERFGGPQTPSAPRPITMSGGLASSEQERIGLNQITAELTAPEAQRPAPTTAKTVTGVKTADLLRQSQPRMWPVAAGIAAALVLGLGAWQLVRPKDAPEKVAVTAPPTDPANPTAPPPTETAPVAPTGAPSDTPSDTPSDPPGDTPSDTPGDRVSGDTKEKRVEKRAPAADPLPSVKAAGPGRIQWRVNGKTVGKGAGSFKVPRGTNKLVAYDPETGGSSSLAVVDGAVNWGKLEKGTLVVRARPWAAVKLGNKNLGQTPFDPVSLPEGRYEVLLTRDEVQKRVTVDVAPGKTATLNVDMRDAK